MKKNILFAIVTTIFVSSILITVFNRPVFAAGCGGLRGDTQCGERCECTKRNPTDGTCDQCTPWCKDTYNGQPLVNCPEDLSTVLYCGQISCAECSNSKRCCYRKPTPTITPTPTPTPPLNCQNLYTSTSSPQLGDTILLTCEKNASYTGAVTYDFMSIHKETNGGVDPDPSPTPFRTGVSETASLTGIPTTFPTPGPGSYGYYLFMCRVCAGGTCTAWQRSSVPTAIPTQHVGCHYENEACVSFSDCCNGCVCEAGMCKAQSAICPRGPSNTPTPTPPQTTCVSNGFVCCNSKTQICCGEGNGTCSGTNNCCSSCASLAVGCPQ